MKKNIEKQYAVMARGYDKTIRTLIPRYDRLLKRMIAYLPFEKNQAIDVLDAGCGTGNLSLLIKKTFPHANVTCLDATEKMLACAKKKLAGYYGLDFIHSLIQNYPFRKYFDAVVVSMVFQNLKNKRQKLSIYKKVHSALKNDGVFLFFGPVKGANAFIEDIYMKTWSRFLQRTYPSQKTKDGWIATYKEKDSLETVADEIDLLRKGGFEQVDVISKENNFALITASRK